jgi:hypothetical protein
LEGVHSNLSVTIRTLLLYSCSGNDIQLLIGAILCPVRTIPNETTIIVLVGLLLNIIVFALEIQPAFE